MVFAERVKRKIILVRGKDLFLSNEIAQFKKEGATTNYLPLHERKHEGHQ